MLLPVKWLKDYVDVNLDTKELSDLLTLSGSHVESIIDLDNGIKNVVVGHILEIKEHPNADKLCITIVDVGKEELQIVTGATNIKEGDYVPVALLGAKLPNGVKIKKGKLRGEDSFGMLCSLRELGISDNVVPKEMKDGIFILDGEYQVGLDIKEVLGLYGEVIEFEITPNRPDCLSIIGMARETSATINTEMKYPDIKIKNEEGNISDYLKDVEIVDEELCNRYYARVIKDVKIEPSPLWLQTRLMEAGVRPINNIVDITNYVMLEFGEPLHAFDLGKINGNDIFVRRAIESENIKTIDGVVRELRPSDLVIADGERPIAIAGVMGGFDTEVTDDTNIILLEAANFDDNSVRLTSKSLNLRTEASARFEKGIDSNLCEVACNRVCQLIEEINAGVVVGGAIDNYPNRQYPQKVQLRLDRVSKLLGVEVEKENIINTLNRLEFNVEKKDDNLQVEVPTFRLDVEREVDLIEEVGRIYGLHNIPNKPLVGALTRGERPYNVIIKDKVIRILQGLGLNEVMTYSFISPKAYDKIKLNSNSIKRNSVKILNPLGEDYSVMRTTIIPNMMELLSRNYNHGVNKAFAYEIGNIFIPRNESNTELPLERMTLTIGMYGDVDYYYIKGVVETLFKRLGMEDFRYLREENHPTFHPGRTANIVYGNRVLGIIGEVHPDVMENYEIGIPVYIGELDFEIIVEEANLINKYKPLPKYPSIIRDLAVVLDRDIPVSNIEDVIMKWGKGIIEKVELFDVYEGEQIPEGKKSIAYSITYRSYEKTLKDEDVNVVHEKIVEEIENTFEANLRS